MEGIQNYQASRKRLALSWYIDFLFFMSLWSLLAYFLSPAAGLPFWLPYAVFVVTRAVLSRFTGSVGYVCLSIDRHNMQVNEIILSRESWLSILLGVLLILEGTKQLVRWTQLFVSQPAFGFFPDETMQIVIHVVTGGLLILAGYWILKLDIRGLVLGAGVMLLNILSDVLSWTLWDPVIEEMVIRRREFQGVPVRDGEVEMMQLLMPEGMMVFAAVIIIAMAFSYPRFKKV